MTQIKAGLNGQSALGAHPAAGGGTRVDDVLAHLGIQRRRRCTWRLTWWCTGVLILVLKRIKQVKRPRPLRGWMARPCSHSSALSLSPLTPVRPAAPAPSCPALPCPYSRVADNMPSLLCFISHAHFIRSGMPARAGEEQQPAHKLPAASSGAARVTHSRRLSTRPACPCAKCSPHPCFLLHSSTVSGPAAIVSLP